MTTTITHAVLRLFFRTKMESSDESDRSSSFDSIEQTNYEEEEMVFDAVFRPYENEPLINKAEAAATERKQREDEEARDVDGLAFQRSGTSQARFVGEEIVNSW